MIPSALEHVQEIARSGDRIAVFLDYDGTLTPIVSHPQDAWLPDSMRQTLRSLAARVPVAILSGRDLDDVRGRVLVDGIVYAGSHGFDIAGAGGLRRELGAAYLPVLETAETELREALDEIPRCPVGTETFFCRCALSQRKRKRRLQSCASCGRSGRKTSRAAQDKREKSL